MIRPSNSAATPTRSGHPPEPPSRPRQARRSLILSWGIPAGFVIACLTLFTGLLLVLRPEPKVDGPAESVSYGVGKSSDAGPRPFRIQSRLPHQPEWPPAAAAPPTGTIPAPSGAHHPAELAARATSIVQDFLDATSLEERLPLISTRRMPGELTGTSLAGRLPNHRVPELERQVTLPRELLTEFYYTATFPDATAPNPRVISILVRQHGSDPPKVLADPFIDLFDGAVRAFGAEPLDGSRTFHVFAEPIPICSDLAVPEPDQRITLRLRPHEHGEELANAYTRKVSTIGEMLNDPRSTLRWGQAHPCIVTVQWNREVPEKPFLELLRLDALTWNH